MIKLNSAALRAAFGFKAKDDVRKQLNGIIITKGKIIGSNGHVAVIIDHESIDQEGTLFLDKAPVATAVETVFDNGSAISYDAKGVEKSRCAYQFEPQITLFDFDRLTPDSLDVAAQGFLLAPDYLALIGKSFPRPKKASKYGIKLVHSQPQNHQQPIVFEVTADYLPNEKAIVCIAPVKE